jgi:RNA polymerase sigma-70 factor (ECF subfamily)
MNMELNPTDIKSLQLKVGHERHEPSYKLLFLHYYKELSRFAYTFVKSHEAAEDVVSDVMMNVWGMGKAVADIDNLRVYLFTAVRNKGLNYLSKNSRYAHWDIDSIDVELDLELYNPEELMLRDELRQKIAQAIRELPPKCQIVYKLVREDGFKYKEVAAIINISENTVDRHLNNALHKLKQAIGVYFR